MCAAVGCASTYIEILGILGSSGGVLGPRPTGDGSEQEHDLQHFGLRLLTTRHTALDRR